MASTAMILIHGHMGCPAQFSSLLPLLHADGIDLYPVTLPGHGGTLGQFIKSGHRDWQRAVFARVGELQAKYERIVLVGHSMGGLLAIQAAAKNPERIAAIVAIALPIKLSLSYSCLKIRLLSVLPPKEGEDIRAARVRELCGVSGITPLKSLSLLPNAMGLLRTIGRTKRAAAGLSVPLTLIHSGGDEIVSGASLAWVRRKLPGAKIVELQESSHFWYSEGENQRIADTINALLNGGAST